MPARPRPKQKQAPATPLTGTLALLPGEMPEEADAFAAAIRAHVRPADVLEEIWLDDLVNNSLEVQRLRRLKQQMIQAARPEGLQRLLETFLGCTDAYELMRRWCKGDTGAIREIHAALRPAGMDFDHVTAKAFELRVAEIEKVDVMLVRAEARRNAALHEIAAYRDSFAAQLREAAAAETASPVLPALAAPRAVVGNG